MFCKFHLFFCAVILFLNNFTKAIENYNLVISKATLTDARRDSVGMIFRIVVNNTSPTEKYALEVIPHKCCIRVGDKDDVDCRNTNLIGGYYGVIRKRSTRYLSLIYPTVYPMNKVGFCTVTLKSYNAKGQHNNMNIIKKRNPKKIYFNTDITSRKLNEEIKTILKRYSILYNNFTPCDTEDQDPFNSCVPVNCEMFYDGARSFYHNKSKRCIEIPECLNDPSSHTKFVLKPENNICLDSTKILTQKEKMVFEKAYNKINVSSSAPKDIVVINSEHASQTSAPSAESTDYSIGDTIIRLAPFHMKYQEHSSKIFSVKPDPINSKCKSPWWLRFIPFDLKSRFDYHTTALAMVALGVSIGLQVAIIIIIFLTIIQFFQNRKSLHNTNDSHSTHGGDHISTKSILYAEGGNDIRSYQAISVNPNRKIFKSSYRDDDTPTTRCSSVAYKRADVLEEGLQTDFMQDSLDHFLIEKQNTIKDNKSEPSAPRLELTSSASTSNSHRTSKNNMLKDIVSRLRLSRSKYQLLTTDRPENTVNVSANMDPALNYKYSKRNITEQVSPLAADARSKKLPSFKNKVSKASDIDLETIHLRNAGELSSSIYEESDYIRNVKSMHISRSSL